MWKQRLSAAFSLDYRSLALFRICLGFVTIYDLIERGTYLEAHYTQDGVLPRCVIIQNFASPYHFPIHFINDTFAFQAILFLLHGLFALSFAFGYRTKLSNFVCWLLITGLHSRNPLVLHGGDHLLRLMWFFAMFLPAEYCFSLDNCNFFMKRDYSEYKPSRHRLQFFGVGSAAYLIQLALMYVEAYSQKSGNEWTDGTATFLVLQLEYFQTFVARILLNFPRLVSFLSFSVLYWEFIGPFLLFSPFYTQKARLVGVVGLFFMHLGFGVCLSLGVFTFVAFTALTPAIPFILWDELFKRLRTKERLGIEICYDTYDKFSKGVALFLINFCLIPDTRIYVLDDEQTNFRTDLYVWIRLVNSKGNEYINSTAFLMALRQSPIFWFIPHLFRPPHVNKVVKFLRNFVSSARFTPAKLDETSSGYTSSILRNKGISIGLFVLMGLLTVYKINALPFELEPLTPLFKVFRVDQQWIMFSRPPKLSFWYVLHGTLNNGTSLDLFDNEGLARWEGEPLTYQKPASIHDSLINHRWYKYFENGYTKNIVEIRTLFAEWVCRQWNSRHPSFDQQLKHLKVYWMAESHFDDMSIPRKIDQPQLYNSYDCK